MIVKRKLNSQVFANNQLISKFNLIKKIYKQNQFQY